MIKAINETIKSFPATLVVASTVNSEGNKCVLWLDGDFDDWENFMIELNENLSDEFTFENEIITDQNLPTFGLCKILVKDN